MEFQYGNIPLHFVKYAFAFIILFIIIPRFIFNYDKEDITKGITTNFIKITFFIILFGYILAAAKIYELISIMTIILLASFFSYYKRRISSGKSQIVLNDEFQIIVLNHTDKIRTIDEIIINWLYQRFIRIKLIINNYSGNLPATINTLILILILLYTGYLRFYDTFTSYAPAMSDGYVTLAWMKYITQRILFHDGIYPQGFHIFLETMHKFAVIDPLYVLKFTGPLNSILTTIGMYFAASRLTKNKSVGIIAALVFGLLGNFFSLDWVRQAATNSQEFAYVFVWPVLYFFYEYLNEEQRSDFIAALMGASIIALVHTFAFVFLAIGVIALCIAAIFRDIGKKFVKSIEIAVMMLIAVVISVLPLGIGMLFGKGLHGASQEFLTAQVTNFSFPVLNFYDYGALISLGLLFLHSLFVIKNKRKFILDWWIALFGIAVFLIYEYGAVVTKSEVIFARSNSLWAMVIPVAIAFGCYVIFQLFNFIFKNEIIRSVICLVALAFILKCCSLSPIIPYKMEYDSGVLQYLKISGSFLPKSWMIVSAEEGYDLVLGSGFHMMVSNFIKTYNPQNDILVDTSNGGYNVMKTEDIFIYYEKNIFYGNGTVPKETKPLYEKRLLEKPLTFDWILKYSMSHNNMTLYYNDDNIQIWHIHQEPTREETTNSIWKN